MTAILTTIFSGYFQNDDGHFRKNNGHFQTGTGHFHIDNGNFRHEFENLPEQEHELYLNLFLMVPTLVAWFLLRANKIDDKLARLIAL